MASSAALIRARLPRASLFISANRPALDRVVSESVSNTTTLKISIPELLLESELGEAPPLFANKSSLTGAGGARVVILTSLELLQLEIISAVARKGVLKWIQALIEEEEEVEVFGTFWDSGKQEGTKDKGYRSKLEKIFPRVVHLSESDEDESRVLKIPQEMSPHDEFWEGVVGYEPVKLALDRLVRWRWYKQDALERMGVGSGASGVLLYGPSGCGKTFIAQRLGRDKGVAFISLKASDVYSKWFGESERAVREAFANARAQRPCILFIDEVDSLAPSRNSDEDNAVGSRVLSTFLNELDGVDTSNRGLMVVAATNRMEAVDDAAIRPGRLGSKILVDLPSRDDRKLLLEHFLKKTPLHADVQMESLLLKSMGYSVAKLESICSAASYAALRDGQSQVSQVHFDRVMGFA